MTWRQFEDRAGFLLILFLSLMLFAIMVGKAWMTKIKYSDNFFYALPLFITVIVIAVILWRLFT